MVFVCFFFGGRGKFKFLCLFFCLVHKKKLGGKLTKYVQVLECRVFFSIYRYASICST